MNIRLFSVSPARPSAYIYHRITKAASSALFTDSEGPTASFKKQAVVLNCNHPVCLQQINISAGEIKLLFYTSPPSSSERHRRAARPRHQDHA